MGYPLDDGSPAECDPLSEHYCCNKKTGWCGSTAGHCQDPSSVNYATGPAFKARRSLPALKYFCEPGSPDVQQLWNLGLKTFGTEEQLISVLRKTRLAHETLAGAPFLIFSSVDDKFTMPLVLPEQQRDVYRLKDNPLRDQESILDVGGHLGLAAIHESRANPGHKVVTLEPSPYNFFYLSWNIAANHAHSVTPVHAGLSVDGADMLFHSRDGDSTGGSLYNSAGGAGGSPLKVPTVTLTTLQSRYPELKQIGFLKLDCEGCEFAVVPRWSNSQWQSIRRVSGEIHPWLANGFGNTAEASKRLCGPAHVDMGNCGSSPKRR